MNITIGQYIPGTSVFHRADPRTKLLFTFLYMILILLIDSFIGYGIATAFLIAVILSSKIKFKMILRSLKPVFFLIIFTLILNVFFYKGKDPIFEYGIIKIYYESIILSIQMVLRIVLLIVDASILTYTTTTIMLTDGLERLMSPLSVIGFPSHDIAMMISIALRFIPTFAEETERIMRAQAARGSNFDSKKLKDKVKSFIPVLVPLFVSAFRRATDLAIAMEARCYRGGKNRTRYRVLKFSKADIIILTGAFIFTLIIILLRIYL